MCSDLSEGDGEVGEVEGVRAGGVQHEGRVQCRHVIPTLGCPGEGLCEFRVIFSSTTGGQP